MNLNFIEILTLVGAAQGLGLSSVLFFSSKHRSAANRVLAVFVTLFSLHIFREIFETHGYMANLDFLRVVSLTFTGYYGPLLYLYVITLIRIEKKLSLKHAVHFIVAISASIIFSLAVLNGLVDWPQMYQYPWLVVLVNTVQLLIILTNFAYIYWCFRWLRKYRAWLKDNLSTIDELGYQWLTKLLIGFISLLFIWIVLFAGDVRFLGVSHQAWVFDSFWLAISIFVYWIGYNSMLKPEIFTEIFKREVKIRPSDILNEESVAEYKKVLIELFEQNKVYLQPELTLQQLATEINISHKKLSQVLSLGFNQTFYNLINQYRVEEVKRCLLLPENSQSKLEVLAYEAGFKSASTFNRQFKKLTQVTPKAFRETGMG